MTDVPKESLALRTSRLIHQSKAVTVVESNVEESKLPHRFKSYLDYLTNRPDGPSKDKKV